MPVNRDGSRVPQRGRHPLGGWVGSSLKSDRPLTLDGALFDAYNVAKEFGFNSDLEEVRFGTDDPPEEDRGLPELEMQRIYVIGNNPLTEYRVWLDLPSGG
jgi:hypothetical protein